MNGRPAALLAEPHRDGINWAMASSLDDASRRRIYIQLSSRCALLSSAAKRLATDLSLDDREVGALTEMQREFKDIAESYRAGTQTPSPGARRFAVSSLAFAAATASASATGSAREETKLDRETLTSVFESMAQELDHLINWSGDKKTARSLASVFESMSRQFLGRVARPGESVEGHRPRSMA